MMWSLAKAPGEAFWSGRLGLVAVALFMLLELIDRKLVFWNEDRQR